MHKMQVMFSSRTSHERRYVIVGAGWAGKAMAEVLVAKKSRTLIGFIDDSKLVDSVSIKAGNCEYNFPVLSDCSQLLDVVRRFEATDVVVAITHNRSSALLSQMVKLYEYNIPVHEMASLYSDLTYKVPVHHIKNQWILPHFSNPISIFHSIVDMGINYFIGIFGSLFLLIPCYPLIALLIKLDSCGPVLYKQERVGFLERSFVLFKFRTMNQDSERNGAQWATENDSRITRVGKVLRKLRIDELPQFLNVLCGDMVLIGPRPERPEFVKNLSAVIPFYNYRHLVKPGITGWAQVNYKYGNTIEDALEKLQYDLYWIKNRSLKLACKIILKSVKVVLTGFGAL